MASRGLLGRGGDVLFVAPPLCISRDEVDHLVAQLDEVLIELQAVLGIQERRAS